MKSPDKDKNMGFTHLKPKNIDEIGQVFEKMLLEFVETFMPENFEWRKGQKEAIINICRIYQTKSHKVVILESPTGGGKSLIATAVSWILNQMNLRGYILASEITLQEQYEKDFKKFNISWGSVKGIDHYICSDNQEKNSLGTCRIRNKRPQSMYCYKHCPYFSARDKAAESPTSLLNYSYWLIMQNYVNQRGKDEGIIFPERDFTICDEGHKILDIVQNHYSPRIDEKIIDKLQKLTDFFKNHHRDHSLNFQSLKVNIKNLYNTESQDVLFSLLEEIENNLKPFNVSCSVLKDKVDKEYRNEDPPKEWREALRLSDWLKDLHCKVEDYVEIISKTSTRNIVKNPSGENELIFNCLEESYMMNKYFHKWTGFTVIMSATFGDPTSYIKSIALGTAKYIKMESNFSFEKSPIFFYNKRRFSYNQMEANLPWLYKTINELLEKHNNENGIIHTASYDLAIKIHNNIDKKHQRRILAYNGTEEKQQVLEMLKRDKAKVLLGPSILEGINLKDEWSRFAIFAKVPYLSLGDKFVKAKLAIDPDWYRQKAIISLLQGAGRSIRSDTDWAITYILDGSLSDLIHNNRRAFPIEFMNRIKVVNE